jgi:hypothetical protein
MKIDLVVTKDVSFFAYLIKERIIPFDAELKEHATPADVWGRHVIGDSLPHCLSCIALSYTEVPLHLPRELVGRRLILEDYIKYAGEPETYSVNCVPING